MMYCLTLRHTFVLKLFLLFVFSTSCQSQSTERILPGAEQLDEYRPLIKDKTIAVVANQTSLVNNKHLVDTLFALGQNIKCVFAPEHGFRGEAEAGENVASSIDRKTGIPIVSLYGD